MSAEPAEPRVSAYGTEERPLGPRWRALAQATQEEVLPSGRVVVTCGAPLGGGGLGRHLQEIVEAFDRGGRERVSISGPIPASSERRPLRLLGRTALLAPLVRFSPGWRTWKARVEFDAYAARQLPQADHLLAFNRQALTQFHVARKAGYESVSLVTGSPHARRLASQHARAYRQYPLERSPGMHIVKRYLTEYEQADRIYVSSKYLWESFTEYGVPDEALALFPLTPDSRYQPGDAARSSARFEIVYVGSLSVAKGVPLLVDAISRLPYPDIRLALVGGWSTRGMRRFIERACARDPRIEICPGDPLPYLQEARLYVHPSYADGFAYAPVEALACGVPVIVSEDTGMKELLDHARNGLVLPTGDLPALTEAIDAAYKSEILGG